jgi:TolB protein
MRRASVIGAVLATSALRTVPAGAQPAQPPPDETVLGTVIVDGSAGVSVPLPKLGILPLAGSGDADLVARAVTRGDLVLSGQFDVLDDAKAPPVPLGQEGSLDLGAWRKAGAEYVVRVASRSAAGASGRLELAGEVYLTPQAGAAAEAVPRAAFQVAVPVEAAAYRAASHRLVDALLGAMTGRPGGFASKMVYAGRAGSWRRAFVLDADGFDLHPYGPGNATILSPAFGPAGLVYFAISVDYSAFRVAFGPAAAPVPLPVPGSVMGLAFSPDRSRMALAIMDHGQSHVYVAEGGRLQPIAAAPFANHPAFGPLGKIAYVAGTDLQRVHVDAKPVSPPGFMASSPVFCDTPDGLLVFYSVRVAAGADIVASTTSGGGLRRFTQGHGANVSPACSPDGRLIAFFSSGGGGRPAGLYVMPIARPWLAKKISGMVGDSLRWEG